MGNSSDSVQEAGDEHEVRADSSVSLGGRGRHEPVSCRYLGGRLQFPTISSVVSPTPTPMTILAIPSTTGRASCPDSAMTTPKKKVNHQPGYPRTESDRQRKTDHEQASDGPRVLRHNLRPDAPHRLRIRFKMEPRPPSTH